MAVTPVERSQKHDEQMSVLKSELDTFIFSIDLLLLPLQDMSLEAEPVLHPAISLRNPLSPREILEFLVEILEFSP